MELVNYELADGVATLTMDDGRANIMNINLLNDLHSAFSQAERDGAAVLLRSGVNGTYSAGFDLKVFASGDPLKSLEMVRAGGELVRAMLAFPRPIVTLAKGHIFPMGLFTILASDYRIGSDGDYKWGLNEVEIGIVPPLYVFHLLRARVDQGWYRRSLTTGLRFSPTDALSAGVFDELAPDTECEERAQSIATRLAKHPAAAFQGIKAKLNGELIGQVQDALRREQTIEHYQKLANAR